MEHSKEGERHTERTGVRRETQRYHTGITFVKQRENPRANERDRVFICMCVRESEER